jgi:hypothetical protein
MPDADGCGMGKKLISKEQEDLLAQLQQDVQQAFQNVAGNDQFWCRSLVRAVFSYLEAHSFVIRSATLKLLKPDESDLESIAKIALLADTAYQPNRTGKLEEVDEPKTRFLNHFAFTLRTYAEAGGMGAADIDRFFGDNAFNQLQRAKKVRDRLTHPKQLGDITVAPAEVLDVTNAFNWVRQFVSDIEDLLKKTPQPSNASNNP